MLNIPIRVSAIAILAIVSLLASPTISKSQDSSKAYEGKSVSSVQIKNKPNVIIVSIKACDDNRKERLEKFLSAQGSPLASEASNYVEIADKYDLDWRLLPAISGVESQFGRAIPGGSYNPYGWNNGNFYFGNWEQANEYVAANINLRWKSLGKITPWKIGPYYAASKTWSARVSNWMNVIGQYE